MTGQPQIPFLDFEVNALGLHLLEAAKPILPDVPFYSTSTNKVYGDRPNTISLKESATRWDYDDPAYNTVSPRLSISIRASTHCLAPQSWRQT